MRSIDVVSKVEKDCSECPYCEKRQIPRSMINFRFASDYYCTKENKKIMGDVMWEYEVKPIPDWCPFIEKIDFVDEYDRIIDVAILKGRL